MKRTKYEEDDLLAIGRGEKTLEEIAEKYGTTRLNVIRACNKRDIYFMKVKILITTPYKQMVVGSIQECAEALELSRRSIKKALEGERVATLEQLEIKVEVYNGEEEKGQ